MMRYFFDLKNSVPLTNDELYMLGHYLVDGSGEVPESMLAGVNFFWNEAMGKEVNGCFSIFHPDNIYLTMSFKGDLLRMAAVAAHELKHRSDFKANPIAYIICEMPFLRYFTIEPRALALQERVNRKLGVEEGRWL